MWLIFLISFIVDQCSLISWILSIFLVSILLHHILLAWFLMFSSLQILYSKVDIHKKTLEEWTFHFIECEIRVNSGTGIRLKIIQIFKNRALRLCLIMRHLCKIIPQRKLWYGGEYDWYINFYIQGNPFSSTSPKLLFWLQKSLYLSPRSCWQGCSTESVESEWT